MSIKFGNRIRTLNLKRKLGLQNYKHKSETTDGKTRWTLKLPPQFID
jgi:hypothetical protein